MSSSKVPKAIFVYGTLRADWGPRGDRWGVLDDKESAVVYEYGHITGYVLKQNPRLEYPFIHADSASDSTKKVFGTLLSWPSGGADADTQSTVFQNKLAHCDSIEGYNPEEPSCGLYLRSAVMVQPTIQDSEPVLAYVYHQSQPDQASAGGAGAGADSAGDGGVIDFPGGDWLASRDDGQDPSAGASASASEEAKTTIFSYGSNGISQLRARVQNPELSALPAALPDFALAFCLQSPGWGGGSVATLAQNEGGTAYGSVVDLTSHELSLLDKFEGGYSKEDIKVVVGKGSIRQRKAATAYIAKYPETTADDFAPPSEQYRTAIDVHLRENWGVGAAYTPLGVRRIAADTGRVTAPLELWENPGPANLTLEAFCVEVNVLRTTPWVMPRTISEVVSKLNAVGIKTTDELAATLDVGVGHGDDSDLNRALVHAGKKPFHASTLAIFSQLLAS